MKYAVVCPYIWLPYFNDFKASIKLPEENCLFIDNTINNIGIMAAHNKGIDFARQIGADWLIVMSASIRFGAKGGQDFIELLEQHPELHVVNGAGKAMIDGAEQNIAMGWHLTAFKTEIFDNVGRWDENFTPYGFDDVDLTIRMKKHYKEAFRMDTFPVDMSHTVRSHSLQFAPEVVGEADSGPRIMYFVEKWGRHPGAWQWDGWEHPFNEPANSIKYWPPAKNGGRWDG